METSGLLAQGYQVLAKDYAGQRAQKLALRVTHWVDDPHIAGRQVGWGRAAPSA